MKTWLALFGALAIAGFQLGSSRAGTVRAGDTIIGVFDSIQFGAGLLPGCLITDPRTNPVTTVCGIDNTNTAAPFASTSNLPQTTDSTLRWGTETSGAIPPSENFSLLTFQGG